MAEASNLNMSWREMDKIVALMNGIVAAYEVALVRTLGKGANAMVQMLLTELGDLLADFVSTTKTIDKTYENAAQLIAEALKHLGIAKEVEVEEVSTEQGARIWKIRIRDSIFTAAHKLLASRGLREVGLSPEGLLVASILRQILRKQEGRYARVTMTTRLPSDNEPLEIIVKQIPTLRH